MPVRVSFFIICSLAICDLFDVVFVLRRRLRSGTESLPSKEDRLLTAGELQRLDRDRKAAVRNRGVCEVCNVKYSNMFKVCLILIQPDNKLDDFVLLATKLRNK